MPRQNRASITYRAVLCEEHIVTRTCIQSALLYLSVVACTTAPEQRAAQLPAGLYGVYEDNDIGAINLSSWAFGAARRTADDPLDAVKAVIAVEYLADEINISPRWIMMSQFAKQEMIQARVDVRRVLGIAPDAPSQSVVDALLRVALSLEAANHDEALRALENPLFSLPPTQTLQILTNMPFIRSANIATMDAAAQTSPNGDVGHR